MFQSSMLTTMLGRILSRYIVIWFTLIMFYGISIVVTYLRPKPLFIYILDIAGSNQNKQKIE